LKENRPTKIRCMFCNDIIWSHYTCEFVKCHCGRIFIDECYYGYVRIGFVHPNDYKIINQMFPDDFWIKEGDYKCIQSKK